MSSRNINFSDINVDNVVFADAFTSDRYGNKRLPIKYLRNNIGIPFNIKMEKKCQVSIIKSMKKDYSQVSYYVKITIDGADPDLDQIVNKYSDFFKGMFERMMARKYSEITNSPLLKFFYQKNRGEYDLDQYVEIFGLTKNVKGTTYYDESGSRNFIFKLDTGERQEWAKTRFYVPDANGKDFVEKNWEFFVGKRFEGIVVFACQNFMIGKSCSFVLPAREVYVLSEPMQYGFSGPSLSVDDFSGVDIKSVGEKMANLNFDELPEEDDNESKFPIHSSVTDVDLPQLEDMDPTPKTTVRPKFPARKGGMYASMSNSKNEE